MRGLMKRHIGQFIAVTLALATGSALALDTATLLKGRPEAALLEKNCIRADVGGVLPVRFETAAKWLGRPDLIEQVQREYRETVSKDGTIDFPIVGTGNGNYHYVNEKNQRTDISELCRKRTSATTFDLAYLAEGKRYFGKYETLIHIHVVDAGAAGTIYTASIYAYPHNPLVRFFARRKGRVEKYFHRKTLFIARIATQICLELDDPFANSLHPDLLSSTTIHHE